MSGKSLKPEVLAIVFLVAAQPAVAAGQWLKPADITYVFVGRTVEGRYQNGVTFSETYRRNGKVEYRDHATEAAGKWTLQQDQFCMAYENSPGGCYRIRMHGANCLEYWLVAGDGATAASWIARSWQPSHPMTCPD